MKVVKKRLPEGVKKQFITKIGKKVKVLNTLYLKKNKKTNLFIFLILFFLHYYFHLLGLKIYYILILVYRV